MILCGWSCGPRARMWMTTCSSVVWSSTYEHDVIHIWSCDHHHMAMTSSTFGAVDTALTTYPHPHMWMTTSTFEHVGIDVCGQPRAHLGPPHKWMWSTTYVDVVIHIWGWPHPHLRCVCDHRHMWMCRHDHMPLEHVVIHICGHHMLICGGPHAAGAGGPPHRIMWSSPNGEHMNSTRHSVARNGHNIVYNIWLSFYLKLTIRSRI